MREDLLQDHVVPICSAVVSERQAVLRRLLGTAFFINSRGVFLTARHILDKISHAENSGVQCGLIVKAADAPMRSQFASLQTWENAPAPYDIAIGVVNCPTRSWFSIAESTHASPWMDVATLGYPETALNSTLGNFKIHIRAHKGYIQRIVDPNEIDLIRPHPTCYELNFPVMLGMSGAPLFVSLPDLQALIGLCVGSYGSEIVDYESVEVSDDGKEYRERKIKVEQVGIAQSIFPLLQWNPNIFDGQSLYDLICPSFDIAED